VAEGKVFVGLTDAAMIALDEKTGALIWHHKTADDASRSVLGRITASPVVVNGVVFTCVAFNEGRYIGRAIALDAKDGHQLWRWDSIPGPGEPGHETWTSDPKSPFWKMGGADVWQPPVVDAELGLVYYGTGNPSPNKVVGNMRPGNNFSDRPRQWQADLAGGGAAGAAKRGLSDVTDAALPCRAIQRD